MTTGVVRIKLNPDHHLQGYSSKDSIRTRHAALRHLIDTYGYVKLIRRLNVLYIYNKHRYPNTARVFREDMQYVQKRRAACLKKIGQKKSSETRQKKSLSQNRWRRKKARLQKQRLS